MKGAYMKYSLFFLLLLSTVGASAQPVIPENVKELTAPLCACEDITCVTVDGFASDAYGVPHSCSCETVKKETLQKTPALLAWYTAFTACRISEHHELIRTLTRLSAPLAGLLTAELLLQKRSKFLRIPAACLVAWLCYERSGPLYTVLSNYLDARADQAAASACTTLAEIVEVLNYLQELLKRHKDVQPAVREQDAEYQFLSVNAYDKAQANVCSYLNINVKIPMVWLFAGSPEAKLQARIKALELAL